MFGQVTLQANLLTTISAATFRNDPRMIAFRSQVPLCPEITWDSQEMFHLGKNCAALRRGLLGSYGMVLWSYPSHCSFGPITF